MQPTLQTRQAGYDIGWHAIEVLPQQLPMRHNRASTRQTRRIDKTGAARVDDPRVANTEDSNLIAAVGTGDHAALMALYDRYNRQAFGLAFRILSDAATAEEVVQDAFMALWRNASGFDSGRGAVKSWLLRIVHNRAIDRLRAANSRGGTVELEVADYAGANTDPWDDVNINLDGAQVRAAVAELPPDQRDAVELAYFQGLTHQEIAERTGIPLGTIKGRLRLGLRKLAVSLAPQYQTEMDVGPGGDRAGPLYT